MLTELHVICILPSSRQPQECEGSAISAPVCQATLKAVAQVGDIATSSRIHDVLCWSDCTRLIGTISQTTL